MRSIIIKANPMPVSETLPSTAYLVVRVSDDWVQVFLFFEILRENMQVDAESGSYSSKGVQSSKFKVQRGLWGLNAQKFSGIDTKIVEF